MRKGPSVWTDKRIEQLLDLQAKGLSGSHIAAQIGGGLSRNAVIGKLTRLGITPGRTCRVGEQRPAAQPKARRPDVPLPAPKIVDIEPEPKGPLNDFPSRMSDCRFIYGTPGAGDWQCCGHPGQGITHPYCEHHSKRVHNQAATAAAARKAEKKLRRAQPGSPVTRLFA